MSGTTTNPYALYVYCDGGMEYNSRSTGGVGIEIVFPDFVNLENIKKYFGRYEGANIERIELEAILRGMNEVIDLFQMEKEKLKNVNTIIILTDRYGLIDTEKTSPYKIREWRRNRWHNHEMKAIKNRELLDKIDKTRNKIVRQTYCSLHIKYVRRKFNRTADGLAKKGRKHIQVNNNIALRGLKLGKRKYDNIEIDYNLLEEKNEYHIRVFKKEPVEDQWQISVEFCEGNFLGKKFDIYADSEIEERLHRHNEYKIRIKNVFTHHVAVYKTIKKVNTKRNIQPTPD